MRKFRDLPAAQFGRYGESIASRMLRSLGAGVVATFKFSGENDNEAPAIELSEKRIVLADLDVSMHGRTISVEIKTYGAPQRNRTHLCFVHGIPVRLFDEYIAAERERGIPLHLGVLEVESGALLVSNDPISKMEPRYACLCEGNCESVRPGECTYRAKWGNSYPQWYFRRDSLTEWHRLQGADLATLQREHAKVRGSISKSSGRPAANTPDPWTWCCLACNTTGQSNKKLHSCTPAPHLLQFWTARFKLINPAVTKALLSGPVDRDEIIKHLGAQWEPRTCSSCGDFATLPASSRRPDRVQCQRCSQAQGAGA